MTQFKRLFNLKFSILGSFFGEEHAHEHACVTLTREF